MSQLDKMVSKAYRRGVQNGRRRTYARLKARVSVPVGKHPGAFGAVRKHDRHCGVDLYCYQDCPVYAVESGVVVAIENFTGARAGCPWWLDTRAIKIEGASGVVCYGEILEYQRLAIGTSVSAGSYLGNVVPVLPSEKFRPDIPGHSCSMLHLQLYEHGMLHKDGDWGRDTEIPKGVLDPTPYLTGLPGVKTINMETI